MYSSSNGPGLVTVDDTEYSETFSHGDYDPETGNYPYVVPPIELPDIPSGTYTGTESVVLIGSSGINPAGREVIGSCRVVVNAENQMHDVPVWLDGDGTLPPSAP